PAIVPTANRDRQQYQGEPNVIQHLEPVAAVSSRDQSRFSAKSRHPERQSRDPVAPLRLREGVPRRSLEVTLGNCPHCRLRVRLSRGREWETRLVLCIVRERNSFSLGQKVRMRVFYFFGGGPASSPPTAALHHSFPRASVRSPRAAPCRLPHAIE